MILDIKDIEKFIKVWNNSNPSDYLWRKKYNIPFGSKAHMSSNHIHMTIDLLEHDMYLKNYNEEDNSGGMSQSDIDEEFDNLKITDYGKDS